MREGDAAPAAPAPRSEPVLEPPPQPGDRLHRVQQRRDRAQLEDLAPRPAAARERGTGGARDGLENRSADHERQHRREAPPEQEQSSLFALASYIEVPPARLSAWQRTRQLLVHHDNNGHLRDATDTAPGALEPEPLQRAAAGH